jgi:hypothetical protein
VLVGAGADFNEMEGVMSEAETKVYQQRYLARWRRWLADLSWSQGPMKTWAPVLTEQQKREQEQYVIANKLPF